MLLNDVNGNPKAPDPNFDPTEKLYRGFTKYVIESSSQVLPGIAFGFNPGCSVNRSKYSEPEDLLFDHPEFGIVWINVDIVPDFIETADIGNFPTKLNHLPSSIPGENYPHSEIEIHRDEIKIKPSNSVTKRFRNHIDRVLEGQDHILHMPPQ